MTTHRLVESAQEVRVKLFLCVVIQLVILLQEGFLWTHLMECVLVTSCRGDAPPFVAASMRGCESFDLLDDGLARVDLINNGKESCHFCLVARHWF